LEQPTRCGSVIVQFLRFGDISMSGMAASPEPQHAACADIRTSRGYIGGGGSLDQLKIRIAARPCRYGTAARPS
jgi:hypothetical protein